MSSHRSNAPAYDRPLALAMAAYLAVRGFDPGDGQQLFDHLLLEERRHWKAALGIRDEQAVHRKAVEGVRRGSAQVTLLQGVTEAGLRTALMADPYFRRSSPADCEDVAEVLRRLYLGDKEAGDDVGAIEPDILGEAALARLVEDPRSDGPELVLATFDAVLALAGHEWARDAVLKAIHFLKRGLYHPERRTRQALEGVIRDMEQWSKRLDRTRAAALADVMPASSLELRGLARAADARVVELFRRIRRGSA